MRPVHQRSEAPLPQLVGLNLCERGIAHDGLDILSACADLRPCPSAPLGGVRADAALCAMHLQTTAQTVPQAVGLKVVAANTGSVLGSVTAAARRVSRLTSGV